MALSNGTYDAVARDGAATEVESIFDRLMELANSQQAGSYLFSGFRTNVPALAAAPNGVTYQGDQGVIEFQVDPLTRVAVNLTGQDVFLQQLSILGERADLNAGIVGTTLLVDLHNGQGVDQTPGTFTITDLNLGIVSTVDISAAADIDGVLAAINARLAADGITNLTARIGLEGNNILFDTTQNGLISTETALAVLNSGSGVDLTSGEIMVSDGAGINVTVDLSQAVTVGDVISEFNAQLAAAGVNNVTMQINGAATALEIIDANGVPLGLSISEINSGQTTAADLGIIGDIDPALMGRDLEPTVSFRVAEAGGTTAADLGILGDFTGDFAGADLDPVLTELTGVSQLNASAGFSLGRIVVYQGDASRTIDLSDPAIGTVQDMLDAFNNCGLDITASINPDGRGIQIVNNDPTRSLIVEDEPGGRTAKDLGIFGSGDMMGSILVLAHALRNNDAEGTGALLQNLDDALNHLVNRRAAVGAKAIRLETTHSRLIDLELALLNNLSEVEDADVGRLLIDLATFENNYKASLLAAASIVQPSLLDFLS